MTFTSCVWPASIRSWPCGIAWLSTRAASGMNGRLASPAITRAGTETRAASSVGTDQGSPKMAVWS